METLTGLRQPVEKIPHLSAGTGTSERALRCQSVRHSMQRPFVPFRAALWLQYGNCILNMSHRLSRLILKFVTSLETEINYWKQSQEINSINFKLAYRWSVVNSIILECWEFFQFLFLTQNVRFCSFIHLQKVVCALTLPTWFSMFSSSSHPLLLSPLFNYWLHFLSHKLYWMCRNHDLVDLNHPMDIGLLA